MNIKFKMCLIAFFIFLILIFDLCSAEAVNSLSAGIDLGYFMGTSDDWTDTYDGGAVQAIAFCNYRIYDWFRINGELGYLSASGQALSSNDFPYLDPPNADFTAFTYKLGADYLYELKSSLLYTGLGLMYINWEETWSGDNVVNISSKDSDIGFEIHCGLDYPLTEQLGLKGEFRYTTANLDIPDQTSAEYLGNTREFSGISLLVGIQYQF